MAKNQFFSPMDNHPVYPASSDELNRQVNAAFRRGVSVRDIAERFGRSNDAIYRILLKARAEKIDKLPLDYIPSSEFRLDLSPEEEMAILGHPAEKPGAGKENKSAGTMSKGSKGRRPSVTKKKTSRKRGPVAPSDPGAPTESTSVPDYFIHLENHPLLTAQEEARLFRKMNYLKFKAFHHRERMRMGRPLSSILSEIERLFVEAVAVKNEIVAANLRLVVSIAKRRIGPLLSFSELISDGNLSLIKAVDKFDYSRGNKFSTYATWAISRNFSRSIPDERKQLTRFRPSDADVFEARVDARGTQYQEERIFGEQIFQIDRFMDELDDRERTIIQRRYGLGRFGGPQTLRQVGHEIGVTKERVRQIETRALEKLRKVAAEEHFEIPEPY